jgi:hypothetical protein
MPIEVSQKECAKCKGIKSTSEFWENPRYLDGLQSYCKKCLNDFKKAYRKTKQGKEKSRIAARQYRARNREKSRARGLVSSALRRGILVRPNTCEKCPNIGLIEAHHWKGYAKEFRLDIQWLCESCHKEADALTFIP